MYMLILGAKTILLSVLSLFCETEGSSAVAGHDQVGTFKGSVQNGGQSRLQEDWIGRPVCGGCHHPDNAESRLRQRQEGIEYWPDRSRWY